MSPFTTLKTPSGKPASFRSSANLIEHDGSFSDGFKTASYCSTDCECSKVCEESIHSFESLITDNTCAILVEPIQGEGGIITPKTGWLKQLREVCTQNNILLILDEIQSGLGRTGKLFAYEHENIQPDGLILGKALGGGLLPVSAFLSSREVMDHFNPGSHGSTFGGNPLAAVVASKALDILFEEDLIALAGERTLTYDEHIKFVSLEVNAGSLSKHQAKLTLIMDDKKQSNSSDGNGPVDATFNAIKHITQTDFRLKLYQVHAITAGTDAQGEVTVRLEDDDLSSQAKGSDPDIIVASAKAYISALNRLIFKKTKSIVKNSAEFKIEGV